jgi:hypothetical protein
MQSPSHVTKMRPALETSNVVVKIPVLADLKKTIDES